MRGSTVIAMGAFLLTLLIPPLAPADVVTDGSLGNGSSPVGPDFWINEAMGERPGGGPNLFHSFFEFSLGETQSATFGGPDAVENILGRVTGGSRSEIFGAIRTAPSLGEVDLYLMNPSGMVFGESASLDVQGSFHATTADYIGLGGGGERFYADPSQASLLSAAPPSAFGFLGGGAVDDGLAAITVEGATLQVQDGESLSLIAREVGSGGIEISGAHLQAAGGRIDLVSVSSAGEVQLGEPGSSEPPELSGFEALGALDIVSGASVEVSGDPPGSVWIRGGRLVVEESEVLAVNQGPGESGGRISIAASESVLVWQEALESSQEALIDAGTEAAGGGGEIDVTAPALTIERGKVSSSAATASAGAAGTIDLDVGTLVIWNDEEIPLNTDHLLVGVSAETRGSGPGGTIKVTAHSAELTGGAAGISASTTGPDAAGKAGTIEIEAGSVDIRDGGGIHASALGESTGDAGTVSIHADSVLVQGAGLFPDGSPHESLIWAGTGGVGDAGTVAIEAGSVDARDGGVITASANPGSTGDAGTVDITAASVDIRGGGYISADAQRATTGHAGTVSIHADSVLVQGAILFPDGSGWGSSFAAFTSGAGDAGTVDITAGSVDIRDGGLINANANTGSSGDAGTIEIEAGSVDIRGGGNISAGTSGAGDAGTVAIEAGSVDIRDGGQINASTEFGSSGDAGTIEVEATDSVFISHAGGDRLSLSDIIGGGAAPTGIYSATVQGGRQRLDHRQRARDHCHRGRHHRHHDRGWGRRRRCDTARGAHHHLQRRLRRQH